MKALILIPLLLALACEAEPTAKGVILQVSRKLRMSNSEPLPPREYFVNVGREHGVKDGDILEVIRSVPIIDTVAGGDLMFMRVSLGQLKLSQVGEAVSSGRAHQERQPADLPPLEYSSFMLGDEVELAAQKPSP